MNAHGASREKKRSHFSSARLAAIALAVAMALGCGASSVDGGDAPDRHSVNGNSDGGAHGNDGTGPDGDASSQTSPDGGPPPVVCSPIKAGLSQVQVNGATRMFSVQMPTDTSKMALLFLWHGWMQIPTQFADEVVYDVPRRKWVPFDPNAFPMPLMIVTPWDAKLVPPWGLDWDIVSGEKDFPFFDAMLQCINEQFSIDKSRLYSFGFSAGAVFTNLLSAKYPKLFAATISESGAWFNDETQWSDISIPVIQWKWPAFDPADQGNVLITHGGEKDYATVISLESANKKAVPFLYNADRTVVDCLHDFGHTLAPDLTQSMLYDYMWRHTQGGPRLTALVPSFPTPSNPVGSTTCTFRPAP